MVKIVCRQNGYMHDFFVITNGVRYYLFTQKFRRGVDEFYLKYLQRILHLLQGGDEFAERTVY